MVETLMTIGMVAAAVLVVFALIVILVKSCWKIAETNQLMVITGAGKSKIVHAGGAFVIPLIQKVNYMTLENIKVDFTSKDEVPTQDAINILVDAVANMSISADPELQKIAASKWVGKSAQDIENVVINVLEGNIREIISQTRLEELITGDKKALSERVRENVAPNLADLGIDLTTFNIQSYRDKNGIIADLGIENTEQIRKKASIAAAKAKAEVAIAQAQADKEANDAKVKAATEIAEANTEFAIKQAGLKEKADIEQAKADAAKQIEAENQRKTHEIAVANANLAKQEKEIELKEREVAIQERQLEAQVKKTAEAEKYAAQQRADAKLYEQQRQAEAELFEQERAAEAERVKAEKKAEAQKALAEADKYAKLQEAEAVEAAGKAKAAAIEAEGKAAAAAKLAELEAEAEGIQKKAEAMKQYGEAAMADMQLQAVKCYFEQLPAIAEACGKAYTNVDSIKMFGGETSQLTGDIMKNLTQVSDGLSESIGIDLQSLLAGFLGDQIAKKND